MDFKEAYLRIKLNDFDELSEMSLEQLIAHRDRNFKNHLDISLNNVSQDEFNLWIGRKVNHLGKTWDMNNRTLFEVSFLEFKRNIIDYRKAFSRADEGYRAPTLLNKSDIEEWVPF